MVKVMVSQVAVGGSIHDPMPTIAVGLGTTDGGTVEVIFAGDVREMARLGDAMVAAGEPIEVDVEDWQVLGIREVVRESEE